MKRLALVPMMLLMACARNEYTGRRQLMLIDAKTEAQLGAQAYQQALAEQAVSRNPAETEPVRRVGRRIAAAANKPDFQWEFNVIQDPKTLNAWCLPGGKIAFYTGIFPVLQDEAGMAFVMGHEVAHALMHHGAERMSQGILAQGAGTLLSAYMGAKNPKYQEAVMAAFGMTVGVGILLPYSRKHESEADRVGLELMAKAGYDPRVSVEVWKRMAQAGGGQPPEFLSTHPSHETRIDDLNKQMPEALAVYQGASKAAIARLPGVSGEKSPHTASAQAAVSAARVRAKPADYRREPTKDGRPSLLLGVSFDQDVFVHAVDVAGPRGVKSSVEGKTGVPAREVRYVVLQNGDLPPGRYTTTFRGNSSGDPFTSSVTFDVR